MESYSLYFKILKPQLPLKKVNTIKINESTMSVMGLLDIANLHVSSINFMVQLRGVDSENQEVSHNIYCNLEKVTQWEYIEKKSVYVGITKAKMDSKESLGIPLDLNVLVALKKE